MTFCLKPPVSSISLFFFSGLMLAEQKVFWGVARMVAGLVGFGGSRSLSSSFAPLVSSVVASVLASGRRLAVGCCRGADQLVLSSVPAASLPAVSVFSAFGPGGRGSLAAVSAVSVVLAAVAGGASVSWWAGGPASLPLRLRLPSRSQALVRSLAVPRLPGSAFVLFLGSGPCFGSLAAARLAVVFGLPVFAFSCGRSSPLPPLAGGGVWLAPSGSGPFGAAFLWSPPQLPLFPNEAAS